jgi:hypothetical protein
MSKHAPAAVAAAIATSFLFAATAQAAAPLQMSYPTDASLTCEGLLAEMARMDSIMGASASAAGQAQGQATAVDAATSLGMTAALHSGVLGRVPGLGMFGNAAAAASRRNAEAQAKLQQETIQTAQGRRTLMSGIYQGKNCGAPAAPAAVAPAAAEPAVVTPAVAPAAP